MSIRRHMKIGSDVRLKSGGELMTVAGVRTNGQIMCVWFNTRGKMCRTSLPSETLVHIKPPTQKELAAERLENEREEEREAAKEKLRIKKLVEEMFGPEEEWEDEDVVE
jgi:uncharacterized protein YodC (DUF2158 family)